MRNKIFHSWRIGNINIRTGKDDQKIERVIHETAKAKISVCCLQGVRRLNNSVIVANKQKNVEQKYKLCWSSHASRGWYHH